MTFMLIMELTNQDVMKVRSFRYLIRKHRFEIIFVYKLDTSCNHRRAVLIYTESINGKIKFIAKKCEHNTPMITVGHCDGDEKQRLEVGEYCLAPKNKE